MESTLGFEFWILIVGVGLAVWMAGMYSYGRISEGKPRGPAVDQQPALRLAEQWLAEAEKRIGSLIEKSEQPLSAAQGELLELRLEASRLPQGVKNLRLAREAV